MRGILEGARRPVGGGLCLSIKGYQHFSVDVEVGDGGYKSAQESVVHHDLDSAFMYYGGECALDVVGSDGGSGGVCAFG